MVTRNSVAGLIPGLPGGEVPGVTGRSRWATYLPVMDLLPPLAPVFLTQREVADLLRVPVRTVEDWRLTRSGPPWVKLGRHVRYEQAELLAWVEERRRG